MKNIFRICIIAFCIMGCFSCKEDFLEIDDPNSITTANYPSTIGHIDQLMNGVYASQRSYGLFGHNMLGKNLYCWDHTQDLSWQGTPTWIAMCQNNTSPIDGFLNETWRDLWIGVQRANTLLAGVDSYRAKFATDNQLEELKHVEGQALFLRAWFYYYLINIWGESFIVDGQGGEKLGVAINAQVAKNLMEALQKRSTVKEVWEFIINDLKAAEQLLANKTWSGPKDKHKASVWAVKAFLGKAYAFTEQWPEAEIYLKDVIDNSGKTLVAYDVFKEMFNGKNEFNSESIFEINQNVDKNHWGAWDNKSAGSGIAMVISPTFLNDKGQKSGSGWSNVFPHDKNLLRFGFKEPVPNPINDPAYIQKSRDLRDQKLVDPRLWIGCQQPYVDSMTVDGARRPIGQYLDLEPSFYGWSFRKYVNLDGNEYSINVNNGSNMYWLRLADVYLLYAEALTKRGQSAQGLEYINKVKRRAYGFAVNNPSAVDYASLTAATMASDDALKNNPLRYERWAELFGEGSWWFDVRRWRLGGSEAMYYQKVRGGNIEWQDTDYAQPIPQPELQANPNMRPNPGY